MKRKKRAIMTRRAIKLPKYKIPKGMPPDEWFEREARRAGIQVDPTDPRILRDQQTIARYLAELKKR